MKNAAFVISMTVELLLFSGAAFAHHSDSQNDLDHLITVTGTVTEWRLINPHVELLFEVKFDNGRVEKWMAYGGSPNQLRRIGYTQDTFKPGEKITLTGFRYKDGRPLMLELKVVRENGEEIPISDAGDAFLKKFADKYGNQNRIKIN